MRCIIVSRFIAFNMLQTGILIMMIKPIRNIDKDKVPDEKELKMFAWMLKYTRKMIFWFCSKLIK